MAKRKLQHSTLPGRILSRFFLILFGLLLGLAIFTPWSKIWTNALATLDARMPTVGLTWENIDRDGPFGFRVRDLRITVAQTPGSLRFEHAYVTMGFSPLATVRLDTGGTQCLLKLFSNGVFEFEGDLNLTYLLGNSDFKGTLRATGSLFMPAGAVLPRDGWIDVRSAQLIIPGETKIQDMSFTASISGADMDVRDFSMRLPFTYKSVGKGVIDPDDLFLSTFDLTGEMTVGRESFPYEMTGTLAEAIW